MKNLLITLFLIFFSVSIFAQEDVDAMLNSSDLMQKKLGLRYAQKDKKYEDKVIEIFKNSEENIEVRGVAARTLGAYKDDLSLKALIEVLKSADAEDLQAAILSSLAKYNSDESVDAIITVLKDGKTEYIRSVAVQTLKYLSGEKVFNALIEALDDDSPLVRRKVVVALGEIGNKAAIDPLKRVVKEDEDEEVRKNAQSSLYKLGVKNENLKSIKLTLAFGLIPINGWGLFYSGHKTLAIADLAVEALAVGMMVYGYDKFNDYDQNNKLEDANKHYAFLGGATMFLAGYILDIVMPVMSVSSQNENERINAFKPTFFTNGETTVLGFSFNF